MRLLGLDPGLRFTGWGVIEIEGNRLRHVAHGRVAPDQAAPLSERLRLLHDGLIAIVDLYRPDEAAVEETFLNKNAGSSLKLGHARGVVMLVPALRGVPVTEYATKDVKKSLVGNGAADKAQVMLMVKHLLPGCAVDNEDASDALAVAICHGHASSVSRAWANARVTAGAAR